MCTKRYADLLSTQTIQNLWQENYHEILWKMGAITKKKRYLKNLIKKHVTCKPRTANTTPKRKPSSLSKGGRSKMYIGKTGEG